MNDTQRMVGGAAVVALAFGAAALVFSGGPAAVQEVEPTPEPVAEVAPEPAPVEEEYTPPPMTDELTALEERVTENPKSIALRNEATMAHMDANRPADAMRHNNAALALDDLDLLARTYRAALTARVGNTDQAIVMLGEVLRGNPEFGPGQAFLGQILLETGRPAAAVEHLAAALEQYPTEPQIKALLEQAKTLAGASKEAPVANPEDAPAVSGGKNILAQGRATYNGSTKFPPGSQLLVSLYVPGSKMPLAMVRHSPNLPTNFLIRTVDAITYDNGVLTVPKVMELRARLDFDGEPITKDDSEPEAVIPDFKVGSTGFVIELK